MHTDEAGEAAGHGYFESILFRIPLRMRAITSIFNSALSDDSITNLSMQDEERRNTKKAFFFLLTLFHIILGQLCFVWTFYCSRTY